MSTAKTGSVYECTGKGGRYEVLGVATGAGTSRGEARVIYMDASTGRLFMRSLEDFEARMGLIAEGAVKA